MKNEISLLSGDVDRLNEQKDYDEREKNKLELLIKEGNKKADTLREAINELKEEIEKLEEDKRVLNNEKMNLVRNKETLKKHIVLLTDRNSKIVNELQRVVERDESIREKINRKAKLEVLLDSNRNMWEKSITNIERNMSTISKEAI